MSYLNLRDTNNSTPTAIEILKRSSVFFLDLNGTVGDSNNTNAENVVTSEMAQSLARLLEIKTIVLNS